MWHEFTQRGKTTHVNFYDKIYYCAIFRRYCVVGGKVRPSEARELLIYDFG